MLGVSAVSPRDKERTHILPMQSGARRRMPESELVIL